MSTEGGKQGKSDAPRAREASDPSSAGGARGVPAAVGLGNRAALQMMRSGRPGALAGPPGSPEVGNRALLGMLGAGPPPAPPDSSAGFERTAARAGPLDGLGAGQPLDLPTRATMEQRFGEGFSGVRIHTGAQAAETARRFGARALTVGADVVFGAGQYSPGSGHGQHLLAHELAHVVQQGRGGSASPGAVERDARDAAARVASGGLARVREGARAGEVHRAGRPDVQSTGNLATPRQWITTVNDGRVAYSETETLPDFRESSSFDESTSTLTIVITIPPGKGHGFMVEGGRDVLLAAADHSILTIVQDHKTEKRHWTTVTYKVDKPEQPPPPKPKPPPPKPPPAKPKPPPKKTEPPPSQPPGVEPPGVEPPGGGPGKEAPGVEPGSLEELRRHLRGGADDLDRIVPKVSDAELQQLTPEERVSLLRWFTQYDSRTRANQGSIVRLLTTTPETDARPIMDALRTDDALLTQKLLGGTDWAHRAALHRAFQVLYNTTLYRGLTIADLEQAPYVEKKPWVPRATPDFDLEVLRGGRVRFRPKVQPHFDLDLFGTVRTQPFGETLWPGSRRFSFGPAVNLFNLDDPQMRGLFPARDLGSSFGGLFPPRTPGIPLYGSEDPFTRFISGPPPTKPIEPISPELQAQIDAITANVGGWKPTSFYRQDLIDAFRNATPKELQQMQERFGSGGMKDIFNDVGPFFATLIGSYGPVVNGSSTLNDKRAEFALDVRRWGENAKHVYYTWMVDTMSRDDIESVLRRLGEESHLDDTFLSVPGMSDYLKARGVDLSKIPEAKLSVAGGVGRGLGNMWHGAWSRTVFGSGPGFEHTYLPDPYQHAYIYGGARELLKSMSPGHLARGVAAEATLGLSDIPVGIVEGGVAAVQGIGDIAKGEGGKGAEKLTPAVIMILAALAGRRLAKGASAKTGAAEGGAAQAEAGVVAASVEEKGFTLPSYKGPLSPDAARVAATLRANPAAAAAGAEVVDALGAQGVEKAAGYIRGSSAAARFVAKNGIPGAKALVAAEGDVAAAEAMLQPAAPPKVPLALPPKKGPKPAPPPGMSPGELAEADALLPSRPNATLLPEKSAAYDAYQGGTWPSDKVQVISSKKGGKVTTTVEATLEAADDAISIKTLSKDATSAKTPVIDRVVDNTKVAVDKAYHYHNDPYVPTQKRGRTPVPGTTDVYPRINVGLPKKITVIVQVPAETSFADMMAAQQQARAWVKGSTQAAALPPIEVIVQYER